MVAVVLCLLSALGWALPSESIDWQPLRAWTEPWRAVTAVFVHYSALHLGANVAGALLVGALGHAARVPGRSVLAWLVAWPLTQFGLLLQPELLHYGGLSGLLHAGVAVAAVHLLWSGDTRQRRIGMAMLAVLILKVLSEAPWAGALRHPSGWDIAVAPLAHANGAAMGILFGSVAELWHRRTALDLGGSR
jgi:rhomboid family GlyGly-CTERM serine protease